MERESLEMVTIIQGLISLVAVIVFFVMADNVGQIRKSITRRSSKVSDLDQLIKLELFKGNNEKAVSLLHEKAMHYTVPGKEEFETGRKVRLHTLMDIAKQITDLGGTVSKPFADYLAENPIKK